MSQLKRFSLMLVIMLALSLTIPVPADAAKVKLNKSKITLEVGESTTLKVTGTKKKPTWESSNKKVATVNGGKVTANKKGTATIAATVGNKKYTCKVTVKSNDYSKWVSFRTNDFALVSNGILTGDVIYIEGDDYLVSPDYYKKVIEPEIEIISAAESEYANPYGVPFLDPDAEYSFEKPKGLPSKKTVLIGQTYTLKLNGIEDTAIWSSSNKSVVAVNNNGKIRGVKKGTATITATVGGKKYVCKVTVNPKTLFANKSKITTTVGKKIKVVITLKTDLEDTVYVKITNETNDNDRDDLLYFDEEEIATFEFGDWNGYRIPIYVTAKVSGNAKLIISSENSKEKIIIPIVIN